MAENHRPKRRQLLADVKIKAININLWIPAALTNVSKEGLCLYVMGDLKKKDKVLIKFTYLENGSMKDIEEVPGVIRWKSAVGSYNAAGVKFEVKVNKKSYPLLNKCLKHVKA